MPVTSNQKDIAVLDRRTLNTLLSFGAVAKVSSELAHDVADACLDGRMTDVERAQLRVAALRLRTHLADLEKVIG